MPFDGGGTALQDELDVLEMALLVCNDEIPAGIMQACPGMAMNHT